MRAVPRALLALAVATVVLGAWHAAASGQASSTQIVEPDAGIFDPEATVAGTATPTPAVTEEPDGTETVTPGETPTATPEPTREDFIAPGYGSAQQQAPALKREERRQVCNTPDRPPTNHMLGVPGALPGHPGRTLVPLVIAIAVGAAIFAGLTYWTRRRREEPEARRPGPLEGIATLVAVCGGLAALAAQFIPGATVNEPPPKAATVVVRDIKPRITRAEYADKIGTSAGELSTVDRNEVGNVIWLEIAAEGFEDQPLELHYGLYDVDSTETLFPGTDKRLRLRPPEGDSERYFMPVWVGYPKTRRFTAEFRLLDSRGVQQLATTRPMRSSRFRYACEED